MNRLGRRAVVCALGLLVFVVASSAQAGEAHWESPPVHPVDMTPDGTRLLAVHTIDHRLVVFDLTGGTPVLAAEIPVGLAPVTVRARNNDEAWVVNHISDSVSLVDLNTLQVKRTLFVGDEPTDVIFAGTPEKAFVSVSQRDLVLVYDTADLDAAPGQIAIDGSDPRAFAVSNDGTVVYLTVMESGNETTVVRETTVDTALGLPPAVPPMDTTLAAPPKLGLIVRHNGTNWVDELNRSWDTWVPYRLYDNDVVIIDVATAAVTGSYQGMGNNIFNVAVNPQTDRLYVTALEARNEVRFEPVLNGQFGRNRVVTVDPAGPTVSPVHLNSHINYGDPAGNPGERALSLGLPLDVAVNTAGTEVYVAAFGSAMVGVLDANGAVTRRIPVGHGPAGLALDEARNQLYVWCRHFSEVTVVDLTDDSSTTVSLGFDPTPINEKLGRLLFYSTNNSSAHGDLACASCHIFTGMDGLAWDLGDPTGQMQPPPQPQVGPQHPMKGPLVTQALKGLSGSEPFHWRGDRVNLEAFNMAFKTIQGRPDTLSTPDFGLFKDFLFSVMYPPNPNRNLDGSIPVTGVVPDPSVGQNLYLTGGLVGGANCDFCHGAITGNGTTNFIFPAGAIVETQDLESPQFRNLYEKDGFDAGSPFSRNGFGFTHDGSEESMFSFFASPIFSFANDDQKRHVEAFLLTWNTGTHATVGQQVTMDGSNEVEMLPRLTTIVGVADGNAIGLIAKGRMNGIDRGWMYDSLIDVWKSDRSWAPTLTTNELLDLADTGNEITFTAVVKGCETRLGVDHDEDGFYDRDELDAGTDPNDPASFPAILDVPGTGGRETVALHRAFPNPAGASGTQVAFSVREPGAVSLAVYDVLGREIRRLVDNGAHPTGEYTHNWDLTDDAGRRVGAGIYFLKLVTPETTAAQRLVVLR